MSDLMLIGIVMCFMLIFLGASFVLACLLSEARDLSDKMEKRVAWLVQEGDRLAGNPKIQGAWRHWRSAPRTGESFVASHVGSWHAEVARFTKSVTEHGDGLFVENGPGYFQRWESGEWRPFYPVEGKSVWMPLPYPKHEVPEDAERVMKAYRG